MLAQSPFYKEMKHSRRLWGERHMFLAVAVAYIRRRRREQGLWTHVIPVAAQKNFMHNCTMATARLEVSPINNHFKMSAATQKSFSYIFICEANKNIDQAKDVRTKSEKPSAFEMVSMKVQAKLHYINLSSGA